jgi:histone-lysine N-methyltransferase SETMAR
MADFKEQRICINFCFCLYKIAAETNRMLQEAFGDNAMSQRKTFLWYKRFKDGRTSVDDDERSGRPSTSTTPENIAKVREAILADRRQTIHDVCETAGLSYGTVQRILADNLNMRLISARSVPRLLSDDQKAHGVSLCRELKQEARDDPNFISNIITGDETWVYGYDPDTKQQSSQWKSPNLPRPKKRVKFAAVSSPC